MRTVIFLLASFALTEGGELHEAARVCNPDQVRQLLSRLPVNETDENGMTPLHIAVDSRQPECVALLLGAGADRNARDQQGRTAVDAALKIPDTKDWKAAEARRAILALLWKAGSKEPSAPIGPMPWSLNNTAMRGKTDVTKMLLDLGANPNVKGTRGTTPLGDAALKGNLPIVQMLLARSAQPNMVSEEGLQALHDAALGGNPEVIRELVAHGADINARSRDDGQTPLHIAASMGKMQAIEALIALGADLTMKDFSGHTPSGAAERVGNADVVAILRDAEKQRQNLK